MAKLDSLATELLLNIASRLDQPTLYNLCLVNKHFMPAAQEALLYEPVLPPPYGANGMQETPKDHIIPLIRTLIDRPKYATKIRYLTLSTGLCLVPEDVLGFHNLCAKASDIIRAIGNQHPKWRNSCKRWARMLPCADQNFWVGVLFAIIPNLDTLDFELLDPDTLRHRTSPLDYTRYLGDRFLPTLFQWYEKDDGVIDLSAIAGLRTLKHLVVNGRYFHWVWCNLPWLESCRLATNCIWHDSQIAMLRSNGSCAHSLTHFELAMNAFFLVPDFWRELPHKFLDHRFFCHLANLSFELSNSRFDGERIYGRAREGKFDGLSFPIPCLRERLETLRVIVRFNHSPGFLDFIEPFHSLTNFGNLKSLIVPQDALLGNDVSGWNTTTILDLLPQSLQNLGIIYPTLRLCAWLSKVLEVLEYYPTFRALDLYCSNLRGDSFETIIHDDDQVWFQLEDAGFFIYTYTRSENPNTL